MTEWFETVITYDVKLALALVGSLICIALGIWAAVKDGSGGSNMASSLMPRPKRLKRTLFIGDTTELEPGKPAKPAIPTATVSYLSTWRRAETLVSDIESLGFDFGDSRAEVVRRAAKEISGKMQRQIDQDIEIAITTNRKPE